MNEEIAKMVDAGAAAFAEYEAAISKFKKFDMRGLCEALVKEGKITSFEAVARTAAFNGMVANHLGETFSMHLDLTRKAQSIKVEIPVIAGGGDR